MSYRIFIFTGLTTCDGNTKSVGLKTVIKNHSRFFSGENATTDEIYNGNENGNPFCLSARDLNMDQLVRYVEKGFVIVPFSKTVYVCDLLKYYDLGLEVVFMKIKEYKNFVKDYSDGMVISVVDKRTKSLF